eukprot:1144434-Pelagomonas_calceolata.AAC.6
MPVEPYFLLAQIPVGREKQQLALYSPDRTGGTPCAQAHGRICDQCTHATPARVRANLLIDTDTYLLTQLICAWHGRTTRTHPWSICPKLP